MCSIVLTRILIVDMAMEDHNLYISASVGAKAEVLRVPLTLIENLVLTPDGVAAGVVICSHCFPKLMLF